MIPAGWPEHYKKGGKRRYKKVEGDRRPMGGNVLW